MNFHNVFMSFDKISTVVHIFKSQPKPAGGLLYGTSLKQQRLLSHVHKSRSCCYCIYARKRASVTSRARAKKGRAQKAEKLREREA